MSRIKISDLMLESGVGFGTSGARGLVTDMTDKVCYAYTKAFLQYLQGDCNMLAIAGDLRPSTNRIIRSVSQAARDMSVEPLYFGLIPSPAVALYGIDNKIPSIMVTGSHIPDDRNGIKFNTATGEISKADEAGIREQIIDINDDLFDEYDSFRQSVAMPVIETTALDHYTQRYVNFFGKQVLTGKRIGIYQHSGVARELLKNLLAELGAETVMLGWSESFIPVDTEAIRPEDIALAKKWSQQYKLDAIVSTDGDADRPLISDEQGDWLRGDAVGALCARFLGAEHIVTPVSSNTAVDLSHWFQSVERTRIGSPYVIAAMEKLQTAGKQHIVGYEANGGFLIQDEITLAGKSLSALPTRDAVIVILSLLVDCSQQAIPMSMLAAQLPARYTHSDRIKHIPTAKSQALLKELDSGNPDQDRQLIADFFDQQFGHVNSINRTDGLRVKFENGNIIHLRPSGNAPELRCYSESDSFAEAMSINQAALMTVKAKLTVSHEQ